MSKSFFEHLIVKIVNNRHMPKAQVERQISPILEIFIESIFNKLAQVGHESIGKGTYQFIGSEFPLNTGSDDLRSFNIDYLLFNKDENALYFVELKTSYSSYDAKQYHKYIEIINSGKFSELYDFLSRLKHKKYKFYKKCIDKKDVDWNNIKSAKLIYIAPSKLKAQFGNDYPAGIITFHELANCKEITCEFCYEWKLFSKQLAKLDRDKK